MRLLLLSTIGIIAHKKFINLIMVNSDQKVIHKSAFESSINFCSFVANITNPL